MIPQSMDGPKDHHGNVTTQVHNPSAKAGQSQGSALTLWDHLKVLANHQFSTSDKVTAFGFPLGREIEVRAGDVTNLLGQNGLIGVNPGLAPGMSGGPVVLGWLA
jgi:hypothetical protein